MRRVEGDWGLCWIESIQASVDHFSSDLHSFRTDRAQPPPQFPGGKKPGPSPRGTKRPHLSDHIRDTEHEQPTRKKRRLRADLVTSMLSRPFAAPSTYIPARRSPRTGPWARQRIEGRDLLRKAAIFNKIAMKRRKSGLRGVDHRKLTRQAALMESCPELTKKAPSRSRSPHNRRLRDQVREEQEDIEDYVPFDAFDMGQFSDDEDEQPSKNVVYSDLSILRSEEDENDPPDKEDFYSFDSFDTGQGLTSEDGEKMMIILKESEKMSEVSLAPAIFTFANRRRT